MNSEKRFAPAVGILSTIVSALLVATAWCSDDGWRLEKDKDGIQVYTRAVPGWSIREFKGVTEIRASLTSIVAVIDDISASPELNEGVTAANVTERDSAVRYRVYSAMKMPWPVSDRDIVNQRDIGQDKRTLVVTIADVALPDGGMPIKGFVHVTNSHQAWTLTPIGQERVRVETRTLADPAGPIPASIINAMSTGLPLKTLGKLADMVRRPPYAHARLPFIEELPTP